MDDPKSSQSSSSPFDNNKFGSKNLNDNNPFRHKGVTDIQWNMLDKKRFFTSTTFSMVLIRTLLYPLTLVRTRLQVQARGSLYTGTYNAIKTVIQYEGVRSLFKGFSVHSFHIVPHVFYITAYEVSRSLFFNLFFGSDRILITTLIKEAF
jgi:hypothetical protein